MGRPKGKTGTKNKKHSVDYKLQIVKRVLDDLESISSVAKKEKISTGSVHKWVKQYRDGGVEELGKDRRGRTSRFSSRKNLTREERLEYENLLLRIELERLKKGYQVKGGGRNKEYVSTSNKSSK